MPPPDPQSDSKTEGAPATGATQMAAEVQELIYTLSHDLQAPLRAITGFSELLLEGVGARDEETRNRYLQFIHSGAIKLRSQLRGLLEYSRAQTVAIEKAPLAVVDLARLAVQRAFPASQVPVELDVQGTCHGDQAQVSQALVELLNNARHFGGRDVTVRVQGSPGQGVYRLAVEDSGPGIEPGEIGRAQDICWRGPHTSDHNGNGIGLALVKRIVCRHGGRVVLRRSTLGGLRVELEFPTTDVGPTAG